MSSINAEDHITSFRDAMSAEGIVYTGEIVADGHLHRFYVEGDPKGKRNGFYLVHLDASPRGVFGCNRRFGNDHKFHWSGKGSKRLSPEERRELAEKAAAARTVRVAEEQARMRHAAEQAQRMWDAAAEATADHPYLVRKGIKPHGARVGDWVKERREDGKPYVAARNALLIRIKDGEGLVGLQAIFAAPVKMGKDSRDKDFVYGQKKRGAWTTIGAPVELDGRLVFLVCEGFATGASLHEATGLAVVPAFDAGNLVYVARELREIVPDARILICGDNDQWTERPINNPGATRAREAASAVGGEVVLPVFADLELKPTDFNDLHAIEGLAQVRGQVMAVLNPPAPAVQDADDYGAPGEAENAGPSSPVERPPHRDDLPPDDEDDAVENRHFKILGHDRTKIYIYQRAAKMIMPRSMSDWSDAALTSIAQLDWWERNFPGNSGFNKKMAVNWLQHTAFKRGYFDPDTCRGRGAWVDDGRIVFHFGHRVMVDGDLMDVTAIDSAYVYEQGPRMRLPAESALTDKDGRRIFEVMRGFSWSRPASAILLAGWAALAPVSGALRWRPHVWLTGGAGAGKSTILGLIHWLLNGAAIFAQGNSTEAGIRQRLKSDALPVMFDESEQNNDREELRVQSIIALIRQSSTESAARTLKGTQGGEAMDFRIRSMFCLSSIQVGMKHQADMERISILALKPKRSGDPAKAAESWAVIKGTIDGLRADVDLPAQMMRRAINLLPTTVINIEVFGQAAAEKFGSQRDGDQYGTLLAGAWSLISSKVATIDEARNMIARYDWSDYLEGSETEESEKALHALLEGKVRLDRGVEVTLCELIGRAAGSAGGIESLSPKAAAEYLARHGIRVEPLGVGAKEIWVANSHQGLKDLMQGTAYEADLRGHLLRLPGSNKSDDKQRFASSPVKYTRLPIGLALDSNEAAVATATQSAPFGGGVETEYEIDSIG